MLWVKTIKLPKVKTVYVKPNHPSLEGQFIGMNEKASKDLGLPFPYKKSTILVAKNLSAKDKEETKEHERIELKVMKKHRYKIGHKLANRIQREAKKGKIKLI